MNYDLLSLQSLASWLDTRGASLLVLEDSPAIPNTGIHCLRDPNLNCDVGKSDAIAKRSDLTSAFESLAREHPNAFFFQLLDHVCTQEICNHMIPAANTLLIVDYDHWTFEGGLFIAQFLACLLDTVFARVADAQCVKFRI